MKKIVVFLMLGFAFFGCKKESAWESLPIEIKVERFDKEIQNLDKDSLHHYINYFQKKYGAFFEIYNQRIVKVGSSNNRAYGDYLLQKLNEYIMYQLSREIDKKFNSFIELEMQLEKAFKQYKYHFPDKIIPRIVAFNGGLNQSIVLTDSIVGIGLDKYLGADFNLYLSAGFYNYQIQRFEKTYLATDVFSSWLKSDFVFEEEDKKLLDHMIYNGKILYITELFFSEEKSEVLFSYDSNQLKWIQNFESDVWDFIIKEKHLFSTDLSLIRKYTENAPFTSLVSNEAPPRIANYIGYKIVKDYMKRNSKVSLRELIETENAQLILKASG